MRFGNCSYCGRKGIIGWNYNEDITGKFKLVGFGREIYCCNYKHYVMFREGKRAPDLTAWGPGTSTFLVVNSNEKN